MAAVGPDRQHLRPRRGGRDRLAAGLTSGSSGSARRPLPSIGGQCGAARTIAPAPAGECVGRRFATTGRAIFSVAALD
jgi:hypothetical protein